MKKQQYYWVVLSPGMALRRSPNDALAEGYESTMHDAWAAAAKAARALGVPVKKESAAGGWSLVSIGMVAAPQNLLERPILQKKRQSL
jgi:hypothetical protein